MNKYYLCRHKFEGVREIWLLLNFMFVKYHEQKKDFYITAHYKFIIRYILYRRVIGAIMNIEEYYDKIYRFCFYKVRNQQTAEDITQEVFLRFLRSDYKDDGREVNYLYTIARNLCVDELRKQSAESSRRESLFQSEMVRTDQGKLENKMVNSIYLEDILHKLPEEDLELLLLRYANDESIADISNVYGVSRFAVYRKIKKAKCKLRDLIDGRDEDEQRYE